MKEIKNLSKSKLLERYPQLECCEKAIVDATNLLIKSFSDGGKLLTMGNGGSSADAEHICGELMKGFVLNRELRKEDNELLAKVDENLVDQLQLGLPAVSLGVSHSLISAFSNDMDPHFIFAQQIWNLANQEDVVWGISTSGNSKNVVWGLKTAKAKGIKSIALTGEKQSQCSELADICIKVPAAITHEVQELHLPVYHAICLELEETFFGEKS